MKWLIIILKIITAMGLVMAVTSVLSAQTINPTATPVIDAAGICPEYPGGIQLPSFEPEDEENYPIDNGIQGLVYPEKVSRIYGLSVFGLDSGDSITVNFYVDYIGGIGNPDEQNGLPARYYALLDEQFVPLGENQQLYRDVVLPWHRRFVLPIQLSDVSPGMHDLVIMGIPRPSDPPIFPEFKNAGNIETLSSRTTLIIGKLPSQPVNDLRPYVMMVEGPHSPNEPPPSAGFGRPGLILTLSEEGRPWNELNPVLSLPPGEAFTFYIQMGQTRYFTDYTYAPDRVTDPEQTPFALIMLDNYQPVPVVGSDLIFYGSLPGDILFTQIPVTMHAPSSGRHDLVALRIDFPGLPLCQNIDPGGSGRLNASRVAVEAK